MTTHHSAETASTPHPHGFATKPRAMTSERTRIKICGLTREQDVDAAVAAGADAVGFVLYAPSPRAVTPERAAQLARRLPPFVTPVLLFVNESATNIAAASAMVAGAIVQFHGDETPADCLLATGHGLRPFLRAARIPLGDGAERFDLVKYAQDFSHAQAILLDAHNHQEPNPLLPNQAKRLRWRPKCHATRESQQKTTLWPMVMRRRAFWLARVPMQPLW